MEKKKKEIIAEKEKNTVQVKLAERDVKSKVGELERLDDEVSNLKNDLKNLKDRAESRVKQAQKYRKDIEILQNELAKFPSTAELEEQIVTSQINLNKEED